jgi:hypothetical protein
MQVKQAPTLPARAPIEDTSVGILLGLMCGNVLGSGLEGTSSEAILKEFQDGYLDFQHMEGSPVGFGG